jgi:hypothetical protein
MVMNFSPSKKTPECVGLGMQSDITLQIREYAAYTASAALPNILIQDGKFISGRLCYT